MRVLKFYAIVFLLAFGNSVQAKNEVLLNEFISNSLKNMMNPIIEYCEITVPSSKDSIQEGLKNYSTQHDMAFEEWTSSLGTSKLVVPPAKAKQMSLEATEFSNQILYQVKQVNASEYCSQLGSKLSNISKEKISAQLKDYEKLTTTKSPTPPSSGTR